MIIIDDLLALPFKGIWGAFERIQELAEQKMTGSEDTLKEDLLRIQTLYELDQISEKEYLRKEKEVIEKLNAVIQNKPK